MRLLHVHSGNLFGGVESHLLAMLRNPVDGLQHELAVCFEGELSAKWRGLGGIVHPLASVRLSRAWSVVRARRRLRHVLTARNPDVLVTHSTWGLVTFGRALEGRLAHWAHAAIPRRSILDRLAQRHEPAMVVSTSAFVAEQVRGMFPHARALVVHPAVEQSKVPDRTKARIEVGTPIDRFVVAMVARIERGKGHELLIDALGRLPDELDWECWIVGAATPNTMSFEVELRRLAGGLGRRVRWFGRRDDVPALVASADVLCLPNRVPEGFGITLVEALVQDVPVVAVDHGGAREIVTDICGVLVAPDSRAVADGIVRAGKLSPLRGAGAARAGALCDPTRVQEVLLRGLRSLPGIE